jgi:phage gp36-like protein
MPYSDQTDLEVAAGGLANLRTLTDQANIGELDLVVLARFQVKADGTINGYLRRRYATPIADPEPEIKNCAAELTVNYLRAAKQMVTEHEVKAHELRLGWLSDIRDGKIRIAEPAPPKSSAVRAVFVENSSPVSRKTLGRLL